MTWWGGLLGAVGSAKSQAQGQAQSQTGSITPGSIIVPTGTSSGITWASNNSGYTLGTSTIPWGHIYTHGQVDTPDISDNTIDKLFQNPRFISHLKKYIFNGELNKIITEDDNGNK